MPAIKKPNLYFDATTYTGTGVARSLTNSGGFQPDLVWIKNRTNVNDHNLYDVLRGANKFLGSNLTNAELTVTQGLTSFDSSGFSVGTGSDAAVNLSANAFVAWQWKAGGTAVTNTTGTISSQVSANPTAGFSVVTYTGTGATANVGHGLGVAPSMVIIKERSAAGDDWYVYHSSIGTNTIFLSTTAASSAGGSAAWNSTAPTSTVFSLGTSVGVNASTQTYVAYCFAAVAGYSAFGSYTGNGSTDGPFVYLGFRPRFIMFKKSSGIDSWEIIDTARNLSNVNNNGLLPNSSDAEITNRGGDILSNGFKLRYANGTTNESGQTYIYAAFAEAPFKYSNGR